MTMSYCIFNLLHKAMTFYKNKIFLNIIGRNDKSNNLAASLNPATNTTKSKDDTTSEHNGMESTLPLTERGLGPGGSWCLKERSLKSRQFLF